MPKKRKTRKEKILNGQKRQVIQNITPSMEVSQRSTTPLAQQSAPTQGMTFSLPSSYSHNNAKKEIVSPVKTTIISTADYGYLGKDLIRTILISGAIVLAELLIRLFYLH
jgi:hypothetical protein